MLLQIVADAWDIRGHFDSVGQPHAGHFPQRRIRLLGSGGVHARANPTLMRAAVERRTGGLPGWRLPPITHKLIKRRHEFPLGDAKKLMWRDRDHLKRARKTLQIAKKR